jgi:hypothetical protein
MFEVRETGVRNKANLVFRRVDVTVGRVAFGTDRAKQGQFPGWGRYGRRAIGRPYPVTEMARFRVTGRQVAALNKVEQSVRMKTW